MKPYKVLITSGGTKVKIDSVRHIGNMSSGTFGSRIAYCMLQEDNVQVTYLMAKDSKIPSNRFSIGSYQSDFAPFTAINYEDFYDYAEKLENLCKQDFDCVVLAAAVSDYLVENPVNGKIRSKDELTIKLIPAPKLISKVREWNPTCKLVGFKLLVDSTIHELTLAAMDSIKKNDCDLVIANDLRDIKANNHTVRIVRKGSDQVVTYKSSFPGHEDDPYFLARSVVKEILK